MTYGCTLAPDDSFISMQRPNCEIAVANQSSQYDLIYRNDVLADRRTNHRINPSNTCVIRLCFPTASFHQVLQEFGRLTIENGFTART